MVVLLVVVVVVVVVVVIDFVVVVIMMMMSYISCLCSRLTTKSNGGEILGKYFKSLN